MTRSNPSGLRLVQNLTDDAHGLWKQRVPYPIERGVRRVAFSHIWNEPLSDEEVGQLRQGVVELNAALDRLIEAQLHCACG